MPNYPQAPWSTADNRHIEAHKKSFIYTARRSGHAGTTLPGAALAGAIIQPLRGRAQLRSAWILGLILKTYLVPRGVDRAFTGIFAEPAVRLAHAFDHSVVDNREFGVVQRPFGPLDFGLIEAARAQRYSTQQQSDEGKRRDDSRTPKGNARLPVVNHD